MMQHMLQSFLARECADVSGTTDVTLHAQTILCRLKQGNAAYGVGLLRLSKQ